MHSYKVSFLFLFCGGAYMNDELKVIRKKIFDIDMKIRLERDLGKRNELKKIKKDIYTAYKMELLKSYDINRREDDINDKYKRR